MGIFGRLFCRNSVDDPALSKAVEEAVCRVEPRLLQSRGYPDAYQKPVLAALEYARRLSASVPGPVAINLGSYATDPYVHAIFPSAEYISEAFQASRAIRDYLGEHPGAGEVYALMGMRRWEKNMLGMETLGQIIHRDVPQQAIFFTGHTIENPAPSEAQARAQVARAFFNSMVDKVAKLLASQKEETQQQLHELDLLKARLHAAHREQRPPLEKKFSELLAAVQSTAHALDLNNYVEYFEEVLLNPERHLRLDQSAMILDSMGIRRNESAGADGKQVVFNDLIGFDRRNWTVTMTCCRDIRIETFASRLDSAYRRLSL